MNDISGINNNIINYQLENAKNKTQNGKFETVLKNAYSEQDEKQLKKVCKDFEQIFLNMMFKQMRATVPKSDFMNQSFANETFEEMLDEKIASKISEGQGIGLADMMYKNLSRNTKATYKSKVQ